jgi:hypothetical protein
MPPAHGKPASFRPNRPSPYRKRQSTCQEDATRPSEREPSTARAIFLLNFDPPYREGHAVTLRRCRYKVFVPEEYGRSVADLTDDELRQADYVLFDLTHLNYDDVFLQLRRICRLRRPDGMPVFVTCLSRKYRGPEFQRIVEKLGARLVYAG